MAGYSSFSLKSVKKQFGLQVLKAPLFTQISPITPSERLVSALELSELIPMTSEKSRSEWLVAPILLELKVRNRMIFLKK